MEINAVFKKTICAYPLRGGGIKTWFCVYVKDRVSQLKSVFSFSKGEHSNRYLLFHLCSYGNILKENKVLTSSSILLSFWSSLLVRELPGGVKSYL